MSIDNVKNYFKNLGREKDIIELEQSSATVELAAQALNTLPARIAKTLSFKIGEEPILILTAGDVKIDNRKYKEFFNCKAKMLTHEETIEYLGHAVGGVCPFGLKTPETKVYTDISLKRFSTIFPACGSSNSAIELSCDELYRYANSLGWIDVCKTIDNS